MANRNQPLSVLLQYALDAEQAYVAAIASCDPHIAIQRAEKDPDEAWIAWVQHYKICVVKDLAKIRKRIQKLQGDLVSE